jgi:preprotein translocase subunit SecD
MAGAMVLVAAQASPPDVATGSAAVQPASGAESQSMLPPFLPDRKGLWIGDFALCRDLVLEARTGVGLGGGARVTFSFAPDVQPRLAEETARLVDRPLAVRIDGRLVVAPYVNEEIGGLQLELQLNRMRDARRIARAARRPCQRG